MNRIQPDDINIHFGLPPETLDVEVVAIDSEFFNQDRNRLHRPHGNFACVGCTNNGRDVYMIFDQNQIQEFYKHIDDSVHAYHNAQYDYKQLRRFADLSDRKKIWDTMLVEQIRFGGWYDSFRLADLARRYLNIYMPKDVREEFSESESTTMTDEQIFYTACDIVCTWMVAQAQREQIDDDDLNIWKHVERDFLWTLLDTKGPYFDGEKWTKRYRADACAAEELDKNLPFNPRSPKQVKEYFKENFKVTLEGTAEGVFQAYLLDEYEIRNDSTPEQIQEVLDEHEDAKLIYDILNARGLSKASKTYGAKWVEGIEEDGRIYPSWKQMGAESGRMSCSGDFPIQTMPHDKKYRECIIAAPDHTLVINDYSSQEPRILAYLTQDDLLMEIFQKGKDIYITVGFEVFEEEFDKKDERRKHMKTIVLGIPYGMGSRTLAKRMGMDEEYAEWLLGKFFKKFPKVKKWVDGTNEWKPFATTILGRKFWLNPYLNGWERNAKNFPMQGSAADCTKIAANKLRKKLGYNPFIIYLHDEIVCEFPNEDLERGKQMLTEIMVATQEWMHEGVPGGIEQFVGQTWAEK